MENYDLSQLLLARLAPNHLILPVPYLTEVGVAQGQAAAQVPWCPLLRWQRPGRAVRRGDRPRTYRHSCQLYQFLFRSFLLHDPFIE